MELFASLQTQGMGLLADVHSSTVPTLIDLGLSRATINKWKRIALPFYGPTRNRRLQAAARKAADGLSLEALEVIVRAANCLLEGDRPALLAELCELRGSVDAIRAEANARVRELNESVDKPARPPRRALRGGKTTDAAGMRTLTLTHDEHTIAELIATLEKRANELRRADSTLNYEQAMADAIVERLNGRTEVTRPAYTPLVVIGLPDWLKLCRGDGDECVFALTDGTTMTGAEFVQRTMATHGLFGLFDPVEGPINLYRSSRLANAKQKLLHSAAQIMCAWPGCDTAADRCQTHHLVAYQHGGETNMANLAQVCPKHNGLNDDNPHGPPRNGHLARVAWHPPDGGPPKINTHPVARMGAMNLLD